MADSKVKKDTKNIRILIAEDNELSRDNLAELLRSYGYEVKGVGDGRQAMDVFIDDKYDLVITDLKMPHVDGLHLLKFVKEVNPESIVIMTEAPASPPRSPASSAPYEQDRLAKAMSSPGRNRSPMECGPEAVFLARI